MRGNDLELGVENSWKLVIGSSPCENWEGKKSERRHVKRKDQTNSGRELKLHVYQHRIIALQSRGLTARGNSGNVVGKKSITSNMLSRMDCFQMEQFPAIGTILKSGIMRRDKRRSWREREDGRLPSKGLNRGRNRQFARWTVFVFGKGLQHKMFGGVSNPREREW